VLRSRQSQSVHVEADIPASHFDEFPGAIAAIAAAARPRIAALIRDHGSIHARAMAALQAIEASIKRASDHTEVQTLGAPSLRVYNGQD
jgi:hypothetical protein